MELDEAFASKDDIATAVLESLAPVMKEYGESSVVGFGIRRLTSHDRV